MTTGLVIGAFDPLLLGQVDLITRAARLCKRVVVAVKSTPAHDPLWDTERRVEQVRRAVVSLENVEVKTYEGELRALIQESGVTVIITALRNVADAKAIVAEKQSLYAAHGVEVIALLADPASAFVRAALVRDVARLGGDVSPFIP